MNQVYISNGVDVNKFRPGKKINNSILFVGRLSAEKNVDKLIEAMDHLPNYRLRIIGDGPLKQQVMEMVSTRPNCRYLGFKTQDELVPYYAKSQYICVPSKFEALPFVLLEGMAAGCIPVVCPVGGMAEIIIPNVTGYFIDQPKYLDNLPGKIAIAFLKAQRDQLIVNRHIARNARLYINEYHNWNKIVDKLEEIYWSHK